MVVVVVVLDFMVCCGVGGGVTVCWNSNSISIHMGKYIPVVIVAAVRGVSE